MTTYNNSVKKQSILNILSVSLFSVFMACILLLSGCGGGGGKGGASNPNNTPSNNSTFESIVLVSPTESGAIDVVMGYKQKILVAGIAKNGTRKLLTAQDGLVFNPVDKGYVTIESGVISGNLAGKTKLNINLNERLFINNITVNVVQAKLQGITIFANNSSESTITLPESYHVTLVAKGTFSDKVRDISNYTNLWSSVNPKVAFESDTTFGAALYAGVSGQTKVSAKESSIESSINVSVVKAKLSKISINPHDVIVPLNSNTQMKASANFSYSNESSFDLDITDSVAWSLESTQVASINAAGILTTGASSGDIVVKAKAITGESATAKLTVSNPIVKSVFLSDKVNGSQVESITVAKGLTTTVYPYAKYSDGNTYKIDLNNTACKLYAGSSESGLVSIVDDGTLATVKGEKVGNTSLILSCNNDTIKSTTGVTVTNALIDHIVIDPAGKLTLESGASSNLQAVAYYSDGESHPVNATSWNSASNEIASVDSTGLVTAHSTGSTTVTAKVVDPNNGNKEFSANKPVEVTAASLTGIEITVESSTIISESTTALKAIGIYSDHSTSNITSLVTWHCKSPITCDGGKVIAESVTQESTINVTAIYQSLTSNSVEVTVVPVKMTGLIINYKECNNYGNLACNVEYYATYNNGNKANYRNIQNTDIIIEPKGYNVNNWPSTGKYALLGFDYLTPPTEKIYVTTSTTNKDGTFTTGKVEIPVK